jgi:hypothetical protein
MENQPNAAQHQAMPHGTPSARKQTVVHEMVHADMWILEDNVNMHGDARDRKIPQLTRPKACWEMLGATRSWEKLIPALIAVLYFIMYGRYGFSDTDDGFMTGFAWRVFKGETIYKDFIYVRTPLTPLIHAAVMHLVPLNYYIITERALFYIIILSYSYLATVVLRKIFYDDDSLRKHGWVYTSAFFVFSVHNFPPFAWYTIDGVFFSAAGAYFLFVKRKASWATSIIAAALLIASALTKQSFYLMPLIGCVYLCIVRRKLRDVGAYLATCAAMLLVFVLELKHLDILTNFLNQTRNLTHIKDAIHAGVIDYVSEGARYLGYCLIVIVCMRLVVPMLPARLSFVSVLKKRLIVFLGIVFVLNMLYAARNIFHSEVAWIPQMGIGYSQAMFLIAAYFTIEEMKQNIYRGASFFVLMMIAWSASISWGYPSPLLFSAPLVFGGVRMAHRYGDLNVPSSKVASLVLSFGIVVFTVCNLFPYRDLDGRLHDHRDLGKLTPRLSGIIGGDKDCAKLTEFLKLQRKYGDRFITLSSFTTSHFITGTINPAPADWLHNSEVASKSDEIFSQLNSDDLYAIVDIQKRKEDAVEDQLQTSDFSPMVEKNWRLLEVDKWYKVYATSKYIESHEM